MDSKSVTLGVRRATLLSTERPAMALCDARTVYDDIQIEVL
ncbi:hypothetical protein [Leptospira vanthielii]|nr:hypothetical protein [Leptospira vanthielii]